MKGRRKLFALIVGAIAIIGIGVFALGRRKTDAIEAQVVTVHYAHFVTRLPETGVIQRPRLQTLSALVPGNIAAILVRPGDRVSAGQTLVRLSNPQLLSNEAGARAAYEAATGRALSAAQNNALLPAQNRSNVEQAQSALEQARFTLSQALTDERNGAQSGLGYGGSTAQSQRVAADANLANALTSLREAQRIYDADRDLYANKAISKDTLSQQAARLDEAQIAADQARSARSDTFSQLHQNVSVLADRVTASRDAVRQAAAALTAAKQQAADTKTGDLTAARADVEARLNDWRYAQDQVARLTIVAPYAGIVQTIATQSSDALRPLGPGDDVPAGQSIITLAADAGFIVRARVDEQDIAHVRIGAAARISGEDLAGASLNGHVVSIGAVAQRSDDPSNTARQIITTIKLDRSLAYLRDGMNVDVDIVTVDRPHVIAVPSDAIRHDGNTPYVFVVRSSDGRTVKTPVKLGPANDTQTIIARGLTSSQTVVVDRNPAIVEHIAVQPAPSPSPPPATGAGAG